jgi:(R,R)-butanediol dehydrogenase / meso-butanediol dehydrogenase / diacetyl reductase
VRRLRQDRYNVCASLGFVGLSGGGGGFSQFVVAERRWIHPLGDLGTDVGALIEPLAVAYHAVRLSGALPEHSAVVFGAGPRPPSRAPTPCSTRGRPTCWRRPRS